MRKAFLEKHIPNSMNPKPFSALSIAFWLAFLGLIPCSQPQQAEIIQEQVIPGELPDPTIIEVDGNVFRQRIFKFLGTLLSDLRVQGHGRDGYDSSTCSIGIWKSFSVRYWADRIGRFANWKFHPVSMEISVEN